MPHVRLTGVIARRPAVPVAVLLVLGICLHSVLPTHPLLWIVMLAGLLAGAIVLVRRGPVATCLLGCAILAGGIALGQLSAFYFPANELGMFVGQEPRLAWVEGTLQSSPRIIQGAERGRKLADKQHLMIQVCAVRTWNGWASASGELPTIVCPARDDLSAGQIVRLLGRLERPPPAMNPGGFDAAQYYRRQRVLLTLHVSRPYDVEIVSGSGRLSGPWERVRQGARGVLDVGFESAHAADRALLRALVFGDREPALRDVQDDFVRSGTTHVLAANGARVAMLAGLVYLLLRLLRVAPSRVVLIVTGCVAVFGLLTMPVSQAIRPVLVCAAVGAGMIGRRRADAVQLLAIAAVAILVVHPLDLYGAGFQFSFLIVLGLLVFMRPATKIIESLEDPDAKVARSFVRPTRWLRARLWLRRRALQLVAANLIAWLIAIPLAAYHFEQLNPWTVPFGLMLAPLAVLALGAGFAKILLTAICPALAPVWAVPAGAAAGLLRIGVHALARAPGSDLPFPRPALWAIVGFYALLCLPLLPWPRRPAKWFARSAPALGCVVFLILPWCTGFAPPRGASPALRLTLLSVGAGQCAVLEPADGGVVLLDAGSSSSADVYRTTIEPFLRHEGCWSVESIWMSHGDFDHISAVREIVPGYGVREVFASPQFRRHAHESRPCEMLLATLDSSGHSPHVIRSGDQSQPDREMRIEVLWPPPQCMMNSNNSGLVLRVVCAGRSILFPADIQEPAERELLKHPERLRSDILIAPHHGSGEATTAQFVRAVDPMVILSSNDFRLTSKQRAFETEIGGRPLYRTGTCGAITVTINRDRSVQVSPYTRGEPRAFRAD